MPEKREMEYVPVGMEAKQSRLSGLRVFFKRLLQLLVCPCDCHLSEGEDSDAAEEEVIEF